MTASSQRYPKMLWFQGLFVASVLWLTVPDYLVCSDEGLLQMRQPKLTHDSFPKQLLSKSLLCPMFFPFKSHQNPWWCLHSQNMTCHPMTKHLDQAFDCWTNALTFLQPFPHLFPLFSRNIPTSLLDPSQIVPTSLPDHSQFCTPCPYSFPNMFPCFSQIIPSLAPYPPGFPSFFPEFSHVFPNIFPWFSQVIPSFVPTPLVFFNPCFSKLLPMVSQIVFRFGYMSSLEPDSCGQKKHADSRLFPWKS